MGKELLRTCLAGLAVHLVVVAACSGGGADGGPEFRFTGGSDAGRTQGEPTGAQQQETPGARQDAGQPSLLIPVAEAKAEESGDRLKARWYVGEDGARQFVGWFDSELGTECHFSRARDGVLRCLPSVGAKPLYTTPDCTGELIFSVPVNTCGTSPVIGIVAGGVATDSCAATTNRYIALGDEIVPSTATYFLSGSLCQSVAVDSAHVYRMPGSELYPSRFVAAQVVTE